VGGRPIGSLGVLLYELASVSFIFVTARSSSRHLEGAMPQRYPALASGRPSSARGKPDRAAVGVSRLPAVPGNMEPPVSAGGGATPSFGLPQTPSLPAAAGLAAWTLEPAQPTPPADSASRARSAGSCRALVQASAAVGVGG
jgi:hypothetical protein